MASTDAMREPDHDFEQLLVLGALTDVLDKAGIQLEQVDREVLQVCERRVADAEVIDSNDDADFLQCAQHGSRSRRIAHCRALRDLDDETLRREVLRLQRALDVRRQFCVMQ